MTSSAVTNGGEGGLSDHFREAMRGLATSVTIVTSRDRDGSPHGMAASAVIPVSMDPPSMLVAVNRDAGLHPVLKRSERFCINLLSERQHALLAPFSQTALRGQRFRSEDWTDAWVSDPDRLPWLADAAAVIDCRVDQANDYGTHTLFVGRVIVVRRRARDDEGPNPLVWFAGQRARLCAST